MTDETPEEAPPTVSTTSDLAPEWSHDASYKRGNLVSFEGKVYQALNDIWRSCVRPSNSNLWAGFTVTPSHSMNLDPEMTVALDLDATKIKDLGGDPGVTFTDLGLDGSLEVGSAPKLADLFPEREVTSEMTFVQGPPVSDETCKIFEAATGLANLTGILISQPGVIDAYFGGGDETAMHFKFVVALTEREPTADTENRRMAEPDWISVTTYGSNYEEELDTRSSPRFRHRPISFTGEAEHEWVDGPAPEPWDRPPDAEETQAAIDRVIDEARARYRKGWRNRLRWTFSSAWRYLCQIEIQSALERMERDLHTHRRGGGR